MAAKSVLVTGHVVGRGEVITFEPPWWPAETLCKDPRFKHSNDTGSFNDWTAKLSEAEFAELHERFRSHSIGGVFGVPAWQARIKPLMQVIDGVLAGALGTLTHFEVTAFEWESGY